MRIVSKNKCIDVNYDKITVMLDPSAKTIFYDDKGLGTVQLGVYETEERALQVMEEIRKSYIGDSQKVIVSELDDITQFPVQYFPVNHYYYMPKE